jgi:hypothetical protein
VPARCEFEPGCWATMSADVLFITAAALGGGAGSGCVLARGGIEQNGFTVSKLLKGLAKRICPGILILSFPRSSTGKFQRPQLLHKGGSFLCCEAQQSDGEWVQRNVKFPELAE